MGKLDVHFSSECETWETPQSVFGPLHAEFCFTLDVCADLQNCKVPRHFNKQQNGLVQCWQGHRCWMNPPYGRDVTDQWVRKAFREWSKGKGATHVVALLPARTDTRWFHTYVLPYAKIRWVRGRIKFVGATAGAPFPSMIAIWN